MYSSSSVALGTLASCIDYSRNPPPTSCALTLAIVPQMATAMPQQQMQQPMMMQQQPQVVHVHHQQPVYGGYGYGGGGGMGVGGGLVGGMMLGAMMFD